MASTTSSQNNSTTNSLPKTAMPYGARPARPFTKAQLAMIKHRDMLRPRNLIGLTLSTAFITGLGIYSMNAVKQDDFEDVVMPGLNQAPKQVVVPVSEKDIADYKDYLDNKR